MLVIRNFILYLKPPYVYGGFLNNEMV